MRPPYDPARATRAYPTDLHTTRTVEIQVFREGTKMQIVNATATSYDDVSIWINQRFVQDGISLPAGRTVELPLWGFYDELGEVINAGGLWRTDVPTPMRLVEIQPGPDHPLIGLITIRAEDL